MYIICFRLFGTQHSYMHICIYLCLNLLYIYMCICIYVYIYMYIHICLYTPDKSGYVLPNNMVICSRGRYSFTLLSKVWAENGKWSQNCFLTFFAFWLSQVSSMVPNVSRNVSFEDYFHTSFQNISKNTQHMVSDMYIGLLEYFLIFDFHHIMNARNYIHLLPFPHRTPT